MFKFFSSKFSRRKQSRKNYHNTIVFPIFFRSTAMPRTSSALPEYDASKLVIDVDAGVDDAFAILLALGQEAMGNDVKVMAVTCVNGNTNVHNVVVNVLKTLKTANRLDIPVFQGASSSLKRTTAQYNFYGEDGLGDFIYPNPPKAEDFLQKEVAANALIRLATENPGEVTLLCLGPLTNVAMAINLDPQFLGKLKQLVVLGGSAQGVGNILPGVEFNFHMDPVASYIVLDAASTARKDAMVNPVVLVPWETIVKRNNISMQWRKSDLGNISSPQIRMLNLAEREHLVAGASWWLSGDPMAAAITVKRSLVIGTSDTLYATVETNGQHSQGVLLVDYSRSQKDVVPNVVLVENIDVQQYKHLLLDSLSVDINKVP